MESDPEDILLEINNLSISFLSDKKWNKAIDGISLKVEKGKTLAIVGESGSGKSVTSLSVMGLLPDGIGRIENGTILYEAKELQNLSDNEFKTLRGNKLAMVFQEPMTSLNPTMSCGKQVLEALMIHGNLNKAEGKKKVIELFDQVKLPSPEKIYDRYPHEISGGQKQRVVIALALICDPDILIADEPTTALDVTVQKEILKLLRDIQKERELGMIFISHDLEVVKNVADTIAVMYQGKIVETGPSEKVFNNPDHPYTKGLVHCKPPIDSRPKRLMTLDDFMNDDFDYKKVRNEDASERKELHEKLYNQNPILEIKSLSKVYTSGRSLFSKKKEGFKAVDQVSFDIFPGETLGLVGESGCGKTTLSRSILKLIEPTSGDIIYKGKSIISLSERGMRPLRKELQIIFQDPYSSLNPRKTVGSAIVEPMRVFNIGSNDKERRDRAIFLLEKTGLNSSHFDRYPHEFSGGQRQRIVIARTLSLSPSIVICDESVSALDVSVQAQVLNLLNDLKEEFNLTYLFISHDLSVVKYMSDRIMVMKDGKIVEINESDQLFNDPQTEYTKRLLSAIPK